MTDAIRRNWRNFAMVCALAATGLLVSGYLLAHERLTLPSWVPFVGHHAYVLHVELSTAQAVTPGQGQSIDISGVRVGQITDVGLKDGHAVVTVEIDERFAHVYPDATVLLRPKTGLKDMLLELDPGSASSGKELPSGSTVQVANTSPDVNLDEILASLDSDSRSYLQLLLAGGGSGLRGQGRNLSNTFRRLEPTAHYLDQATALVAERRRNVARLVHNFSLLAVELGHKDRQLSRFVSSSNAVFQRFADQNANLGETISLLPGALDSANRALAKTTRLANVLRPTLTELRPAARALGPSLDAAKPFLTRTAPVLRDQLRPFARTAQEPVSVLVPAAERLAQATPGLTRSGQVLNYALNELAYKPPGGTQGYLFYLPWANHNGNSVFSGQDGSGPIRRGVVLVSCSTLTVLKTLADPSNNPTLATLIQLLNAPSPEQACAKP